MATTVLPDDLWKRLEPLLPKPKENRNRSPACEEAWGWNALAVAEE
jgi:hypothetical protein